MEDRQMYSGLSQLAAAYLDKGLRQEILGGSHLRN